MLERNQFLHIRAGENGTQFELSEHGPEGEKWQAFWLCLPEFGRGRYVAVTFDMVISHLKQSVFERKVGQEKVILRVPYLGPDTITRTGKAWLVPAPGGLTFLLPDSLAVKALGRDEISHTVSWEIPLSYAKLAKIPKEFLVFYTGYWPGK